MKFSVSFFFGILTLSTIAKVHGFTRFTNIDVTAFTCKSPGMIFLAEILPDLKRNYCPNHPCQNAGTCHRLGCYEGCNENDRVCR